MRSLGVASLIAAGSLSILSCDRSADTPTVNVRQEPVVVYAAFEDDAILRDLIGTYTDETGVYVTIRRGAAGAIVGDLIENKVSPPADVLMTQSVTHIWRAAEEGALRPLFSDDVRERSPAWSRDPDDLWFATAFRAAVVVHDMPSLSELPDFKALAEPRFRGSLCLSSSANAINRTVIAMMVESMGTRPAEIAVRGWMANLALPVFDTEAQVIAAIGSGSCRIGIVSSTAAAGLNPELAVLTPDTTYADIDGIGIGRHARNPEGAAALVEWIISTAATDWDGSGNVSRRNVGLVAWHETDAVKLAERARYP